MSEITPLPDEIATAVQGNVQLVRDELLKQAGVAQDDWPSAVMYLSGFLDRQREHADASNASRLAQTIGCYLGEAIVRHYGGRWMLNEANGVGIDIDGLHAFPLNKAAKHLQNGSEDNINSFFSVIPKLLEQRKERKQ
ncbi:hypothetical protein [uncultured Tateyamaria sp.]|uniref:hypothetical protein n=1 Tax=uncultured Tateyamaria sp. TaxID=455651 RepID=UPI00263138A5|nr:hypothetical protein [uncultured Tateyamaria sp.]